MAPCTVNLAPVLFIKPTYTLPLKDGEPVSNFSLVGHVCKKVEIFQQFSSESLWPRSDDEVEFIL